mgnify:CR=1 FL=1
MQPDLGSVLVLLSIWFTLLLIAGLHWRYFIITAFFSGLSFISGWLWFLKDYQKDRLRVFLDPSLDPLGQGYNVIQSIIAIGSGGFWGKGLGYGSQSQLHFLPEAHTDFIFAVIAEQLGFIGIFFLLIFYGFLFYKIWQIAKEAPDNFSKFLAVGIMIFFLVHVGINIGMNLGLMPVIGIPLIFLSYGGSSMLVSFLAIGLLQAVRRRSRVW